MRKLLLVDDDPDCLDLLSEMLQLNHANATMLTTEKFSTALKIAKSEHPDLILTDWDIDDHSGYDLLIRLKSDQETQNIPIIIATGKMTSPEFLKKALDSGASDFIKKPFEVLELNARVDAVLRSSISQKQMIEMKNKEIALHTMYLHQTNEYTWKDVEKSLVQVQPTFTKNLALKYPDLSPAETRLSILLSMNMDTKAIANFLNISVESVKVARKRLRKKLNLSSEDCIVSALQSI